MPTTLQAQGAKAIHADLGGVRLLLGLLNRRFAPHNPSAEKLLSRLAVHRLGEERKPAHQVIAFQAKTSRMDFLTKAAS